MMYFILCITTVSIIELYTSNLTVTVTLELCKFHVKVTDFKTATRVILEFENGGAILFTIYLIAKCYCKLSFT
jgi:hypothetical protein